MKKVLLTSLVVVLANVANAQLFVKDGSYVFMTNQYMTVTQDVNLNATGNFYLRNTSQLLQKSTGSGLNSGTGKLSVFQEGTVNNYQYNQWCSPVGNGAGTGSDSGDNLFGVSLLNRPTTLIGSTAAEILPVSGLNGTPTGGAGGTMQIAPYWIWKFVSLSPLYANWQFVGNTVSLNPGEGFTMKGTTGSNTDATIADAVEGVQNKTGLGQRYDFRGRPNDGNITVAVSAGNNTLIGNPYPSAINLNMFLVENRGDSFNAGTGVVTNVAPPGAITGTAYFWEHSKAGNSHTLTSYVGGYGTYVANGANIATPGAWVAATWDTYTAAGVLATTGAGTGATFQRQFSPVGQGFMVKGDVGGSVTMKNDYRQFTKEGATSTFEKTANAGNVALGNSNWEEIPNVLGLDYTKLSKLPVPQIKLEVILNNSHTRQIAMAFNPSTTDGYDNGYDGIAPDDTNANLVSFNLDNNTKKTVITTFPYQEDKRVALSFKNDAVAKYKVTVSEFINFTDTDKVYVYDKATGIYYDIVNNAFEIELPAGDNTSRFEVTFKNFTALTADDNALASDSFEVYQNNTNSTLTIANTLGKNVSTCMVYDVTGKLVISKKNLGKNTLIELPTNALSDGVYIVKLNTTDNVSVEKKIIVGN